MDKNIVLSFAIIVVLIAAAYMFMITEKGTETYIVDNLRDSTNQSKVCMLSDLSFGKSSIKVPAIDEDGNGIVTVINVDSIEGSGRALVDINQLLFWTDTQYSIQASRLAAEQYTGYDLSNVDIIYSIDIKASLIEGPSAGAAMTIATIASLYNETINQSVMITGTIEENGTIGRVGGISEKATAARDVGAMLFLVPHGQSEQTYSDRDQECKKVGPFNYCTTEYEEVISNVGEKVGIEVKEVSNIEEALPYFIDTKNSDKF